MGHVQVCTDGTERLTPKPTAHILLYSPNITLKA
jgi:hypothetical protein